MGFRAKRMCYAASGLALCLVLGACGSRETTIQQALGYDQRGPDEMAVIKRPPLILPPDFNLRPPRAGDQEAAEQAASDAAREALVGASPSSETEPLSDEATKAREILTRGKPSSDASETLSDGQSVLISRTNRTVRDLDGLTETRAENRVDSALLRRLLAWTPEDRASSADAAADAPASVQVVDRSQTVIDDSSSTSQ